MMGPVALLVGEEGVAAEIAMPLVTVKDYNHGSEEKRKDHGRRQPNRSLFPAYSFGGVARM
jgi:hypothetical protein